MPMAPRNDKKAKTSHTAKPGTAGVAARRATGSRKAALPPALPAARPAARPGASPAASPADTPAVRGSRRAGAAPSLSHLDGEGRVQMVDVAHKPETARLARARALLRCAPAVRDALWRGTGKKGEAIATAKVAGILAAKQTGALIPLCHPIGLTDVQLVIDPVADGLAIEATASCVGRTGVEMEAMVAASVCGLVLYDMGKAAQRDMVLDAVRLVEKRGGKSGVWRRASEGA
jgi:cyclic pyranopterin phosphate synthase